MAGVILLVEIARDVPSRADLEQVRAAASLSLEQVRNDAAIALQVVEQHGDEFLALRSQIAALRAELTTELENFGEDRFYRREWKIHDRRIQERFAELESDIERHETILSRGVPPPEVQRGLSEVETLRRRIEQLEKQRP